MSEWKTVTLSQDEHEKLVKLWKATLTTPVIYTSPGRSWADIAVSDLKAFMDELGNKYGYDPTRARISQDSASFQAPAVKERKQP